MSGLYECHGHLMMDGADFSAARERHKNAVDETAVRAALAGLRDAGVTWYRDGGDAYGVSALGREIAGEYGIECVTPVFAAHKNGYYGGIVGRGFDDAKGFRQLVRELGAAGGDFVKIMLSGIITFRSWGDLSCPGLEADEIRELVKIAHGEGYAVMVHCNGPGTIRAAALAGADSMEHGYFPDAAALEAMAENNTLWVPTLAATEAFIGREGIDRAVAETTVARQLEALRAGRAMGIMIAAGSDSGAVGVPHGPGIRREYELLAQAGLTPAEIDAANKKIREVFTPRR